MPSEAEKWREEAECYRALYGKYFDLWAKVSKEEKAKAANKLREERRGRAA